MNFFRVYDGNELIVECIRQRDVKTAKKRCLNPRVTRVENGVEREVSEGGNRN